MKGKYMFDASAIVNLVKRGIVRVFAEGYTLNLALYEALNAVWKEHVRLKRYEKDEAEELVEIIAEAIETMRKLPISGDETEVYRLAVKERITVYDSCYLYVALRNGLTLVTDDSRLAEAASGYVEVVGSHRLYGQGRYI